MDINDLKPITRCTVEPSGDGLVARVGDEEYLVENLPIDTEKACRVIGQLDGNRSVSDVLASDAFDDIPRAHIEAMIQSFFESGLIDKNESPDCVSGFECILELEDLQNELLYKTLYRNVFWEKCQDPSQVPLNVFYGMAIENYHFLFRESWFDSPILGFATSTESRVLMNHFFCEEYGHDELILKSLNEIGITREQIYRTVPLPETLALCNSLAHWSATDPLFFFSTMGVLEGKDLKLDSYVNAMEESGTVQEDFIKYIKSHSNINLQDAHGNLSREIFRRIPVVARSEIERMKRQTHMFIEIYDRFYTAIWEHYSTTSSLLRLVN
ncbi:MAG: hypothetical protein E6Q88_03690 [Lysobacteraceae bacterium]|nr:MAG: hypothetical protein E6Q88_03690 [Xanthomonadaceae bacterium]